jgi:hypothetical protein
MNHPNKPMSGLNFLPLLGERAGVREVVKIIFPECKTSALTCFLSPGERTVLRAFSFSRLSVPSNQPQ